jgi:hypothetical protein
MYRRLSAFALCALAASCGTTEETEAAPTSATEQADEEPPPFPTPVAPAEPAAIADCPTDTWSVAPDGPNRATNSGVEAAGWARTMGPSWTRLRACKSIDGFEHLMSCGPVPGGAECNISLPAERCTASLPRPTLPIVIGQWIDTHAQPSEGSWSCTRR